MQTFLFFVTICLYLAFVFDPSRAILRTRLYHRFKEADNKKPRVSVICIHHNMRVVECGIKCTNTYLCSSFFHTGNNNCLLSENIPLHDMVPAPGYTYFVSNECKRSTVGWEYSGTQDRTISGIPCQRWDQQVPHAHNYTDLADQENFCRNHYRDHKTNGPWCYTTDINKKWDYCYVPKCVTPVRECLTSPKGGNYFGHMNVTRTGLTCQRWGDTTPHNHSYTYLKEQGNYCRNPFATENTIWCLTTSKTVRWELCNIPKCSPNC